MLFFVYENTVDTLRRRVTGLKLSSQSSVKLALYSPDVKPVNSVIALQSVVSREGWVSLKLLFCLCYLPKMYIVLRTALFSHFKS